MPTQPPSRSGAAHRSSSGRQAPSRLRERSRHAMDLPARFQIDDEDDGDDGTGVGNDESTSFAQRSVYGMLAAAQSRNDFMPPIQQDSESESEGGEPRGSKLPSTSESLRIDAQSRRGGKQRSGLDVREQISRQRARGSHANPRLAQSWFKPPPSPSNVSSSRARDAMTQSQFLSPFRKMTIEDQGTSADAISAGADTNVHGKSPASALAARMASPVSPTDAERKTDASRQGVQERESASEDLSKVISNIFQFDEVEDVISEYSCWYVQNVLLEGYMYITQKHVCFYAYLKKKTSIKLKSGHLGKQGKHSYNYSRYYFVLKGDTFSYYRDASQPYNPLGLVDLRYATSADVTMDEDKETADFTIKTTDRTYYYRADNEDAAKEWVKQLRKAIFRSHNDGDSVKISLPIDSILAVDRMSMVDYAETVKIRVLASDETYVVDEYFFTFWTDGQEALNTLTTLAETSSAQADDDAEDEGKNLRRKQELSPALRAKKTTGRTRRSASAASQGSSQPRRSSISRSPGAGSVEASTESFATSSDQPMSSDGEEIDANMSASQMLIDDGVFAGPTLRTPQPRPGFFASAAAERLHKPARPHGPNAGREEPAKTSTDQNLGSERPALGNRSGTADSSSAARGIRIIGAPLQHAMTVAGMVRTQSQRVGSYLSSSPKTYIGKWSDAYAGGKRTYGDGERITPDDSAMDLEASDALTEAERRFRAHFGLPQSEKLVATYFCYLIGNLPAYGKIYMGTSRLCFRSLIYGTSTKIVLPFKEIVTVQRQRGFRFRSSGLVFVLRGHEELFFDFSTTELRDDCDCFMLQKLESLHGSEESVILTAEERQYADEAAAENQVLLAARRREDAGSDTKIPQDVKQKFPAMMFDDPTASIVDFKPPGPMRITCLTIGSRGDVQPYIALCKGLLAQGHKPKIATHAEFGPWVISHGIEFVEVGGDPAELMRICVEKGMFTPGFFMEANANFRVWLDGLLDSAWTACQGSDLLIESPSAMCGIHIAEALEIPYFRAFTMPWSRTRTYPHAFAVPNRKMGGGYNYMSYTFFDNIFWQAIAGQINRWRGAKLGLPSTSLDKMQQNRVPFMYNFSPNVVAPPLDFSDWIKVTGYWFLDEGSSYKPPKELADFIANARADNVKLVYIGFGSVTVADSRQLTQQIVEAVEKADVRCILSKGWSDRFDKKDATIPEIPLPPSIHQIRSAPHDWLFRQIDAVVIHGGAGTTGAALRAGKPTIIKPFFGDQYFFATRVEDLGVGIHVDKVTANQLGRALWVATHDGRMQKKARILGEKIRAEDGVQTAIDALWRDLEYARSLVKRRAGGHASASSAGVDAAAAAEDTEENWTFVDANDEELEDMLVDTGAPGDAASSSAAAAAGKRSTLSNLRIGSFVGRR